MNHFKETLTDPYKEGGSNRESPKLDAELLREKLYKLSSCSSESSNRGSIDETLSDDPIEYYEYFMNMAKIISRKKKNKKQRVSFCLINFLFNYLTLIALKLGGGVYCKL